MIVKSQQNSIELVTRPEELKIGDINSLAVLMGNDIKSLKLREILTEELVQLCRKDHNPPRIGPKTAPKNSGSKDFSNKKLALSVMDIAMYFLGFEKFNDFYPYCQEKIDRVLQSWSDMLIVKHIEELDYGKKVRECSFCGIKEDEMNANYVRHVEKCKLQHKSCDCEVTFRNPIDKERHMKLKHSKNKYIECKECPAIFGDNAKGEIALRNHVKKQHFSEEPLFCEVCCKSYTNENQLWFHRLGHEIYFCYICQQEIMGRNIFKAHELKVHNSGFKCEVCAKQINTKRALGIHMKRFHNESWKK